MWVAQNKQAAAYTLLTSRKRSEYSQRNKLPTLMYVCPCIIYEIDERYPLDATIYYYKQFYMFRASICPSSGVLGCIRIILLHMVSITTKENCALVG